MFYHKCYLIKKSKFNIKNCYKQTWMRFGCTMEGNKISWDITGHALCIFDIPPIRIAAKFVRNK